MFKIILSNSKDAIPVKSIEEVERILERINAGDNIIVCSNGVFNSSYMVAILEDRHAREDEAYLSMIGYKDERDSEFAKLLSPKMKMSLRMKMKMSPRMKISPRMRMKLRVNLINKH